MDLKSVLTDCGDPIIPVSYRQGLCDCAGGGFSLAVDVLWFCRRVCDHVCSLSLLRHLHSKNAHSEQTCLWKDGFGVWRYTTGTRVVLHSTGLLDETSQRYLVIDATRVERACAGARGCLLGEPLPSSH